MNEHQFVFIAGLHRSGTTLLHDCLADHPQISGLTDTGVPMNEGQFLQDVFPPAGTRRKLWPVRYLKPVAPSFLTSRGYGGPGRFAFDPGAWLTEESPLATKANAESILASWRPYWDMSRPLLAEKSPPNLTRTRLLQSLFPNSYFIVVLRHPVPVSYATRRWANLRPYHLLLEHWAYAHERAFQDLQHLRRVICLRYEDFVEEPQATLDGLFRFLGVDTIPLGRKVSAAVNAEYYQRWNQALAASRMWRRYAGYMSERFEARFNRFGYTLGTPQLVGARAGRLDDHRPLELPRNTGAASVKATRRQPVSSRA
jgi:hypothetical protein